MVDAARLQYVFVCYVATYKGRGLILLQLGGNVSRVVPENNLVADDLIGAVVSTPTITKFS